MVNETMKHKVAFSMALKFLHSLVRVLIQSRGTQNISGPTDGVGWVSAYGEICGWKQLMSGALSWNIGFTSKEKS